MAAAVAAAAGGRGGRAAAAAVGIGGVRTRGLSLGAGALSGPPPPPTATTAATATPVVGVGRVAEPGYALAASMTRSKADPTGRARCVSGTLFARGGHINGHKASVVQMEEALDARGVELAARLNPNHPFG